MSEFAGIYIVIKSFLDINNFCRLLKTFAKSLEPGQDRQNDSVPEIFFEKVNFEINQRTTTKA